MAAAAAQLARLLALVPWLQARPGVTKAEAAAAFGITVDQLDKDLQLAFTCELPGQPEVFIDIDYLDSDRITVLDAAGDRRPLRLRAGRDRRPAGGPADPRGRPGAGRPGRLDSVLAKLEDAGRATCGSPSGPTEPPAAGDGSAGEVVAGGRLQARCRSTAGCGCSTGCRAATR